MKHLCLINRIYLQHYLWKVSLKNIDKWKKICTCPETFRTPLVHVLLYLQWTVLYFLVFRDHLMWFVVFENWIPLKPVLGGVGSVAPFINVNEQSESNQDCIFFSSIAHFASGRSYHHNLFKSTLAGAKWLCDGRKTSPRTSSLVQVDIPSGLSRSWNVILCIQILNTT